MKLFQLLLVGVTAGLSAGVRSGLSDGIGSAAVGSPVRVASARGSHVSPASAGAARTGLTFRLGLEADRGIAFPSISARSQLSNGTLFPAGSPLQAASLRRELNSVEPSPAGTVFSDARIADAIRTAEGRTAGAYRYGIRAAKSEADGRRRCLATIRANRARWIAAGARGEFIDFLADRYCPPSCDPVGNRNWKRNVKFFLSK